MSARAMSSPSLSSSLSSSPIRTPSMFAGGFAPWGPTPSPTPKLRYQPPIAEGCSSSDSSGSQSPEENEKVPQANAAITEALLIAICAPFLENMVKALVEAVQAQCDKEDKQTDDEVTTSYDAAKFANPEDESESAGGPFQSLLYRLPCDSGTHVWSGRDGGTDAPLSSSFERRTPSAPKPLQSLSPSTSPGATPVTSLGSCSTSAGTTPTTSVDLAMQRAYRPSRTAAQQREEGPPVISQSIPQNLEAAVVAPGKQTEGGTTHAPTPQTADASRENATSSAELGRRVGSREKCVMVCRHWKSKGWCRLEAGCKFLHPEHKRGISAPTKTSDGISSQKPRDGEIVRGASIGNVDSSKQVVTALQALSPARAHAGSSTSDALREPASPALAVFGASMRAGDDAIGTSSTNSRGSRRHSRGRHGPDLLA